MEATAYPFQCNTTFEERANLISVIAADLARMGEDALLAATEHHQPEVARLAWAELDRRTARTF